MTLYTIGLGTSEVEGWDGGYNQNYVPGDIIEIAPGTRTTRLRFRNIIGIEGEPPIIIRNGPGGQVNFSGIPVGVPSLLVQNTRHVHMTRTIDPAIPKGWLFDYTYNAQAVRFQHRCEYIELDHFEISECDDSGIFWNTGSDGAYDYGPNAPAGPSTMGNYRYTKNIHIHDLYIHDVNGEGIYFGKANAFQVPYEPIHKNCLIERITTERTGGSGLDLKTNVGLVVRDVSIEDWGQRNDRSHSQGINVDRNCEAALHNIIFDGTNNSSPGILVLSGRVPVTLRRITIKNAGNMAGDNGNGRGLHVTSALETDDHPNGYIFMDGFLIDNPRTDGIRFANPVITSVTRSRLRNGVISNYSGVCISIANGATLKQDNVVCIP